MTTFAEVFEEEVRQIKVFDGYAVEIGVFESENVRDKTSVTNAQLMYLHENGAPAKNIPPRPVLRLSIDYLSSTLWPKTREYILDRIFKDHWGQAEIEKELMQMCKRLRSYAKYKVIGEGKMLAKLKHRKGIPLKDTGDLQRSIRCVLLKNGQIIGP